MISRRTVEKNNCRRTGSRAVIMTVRLLQRHWVKCRLEIVRFAVTVLELVSHELSLTETITPLSLSRLPCLGCHDTCTDPLLQFQPFQKNGITRPFSSQLSSLNITPHLSREAGIPALGQKPRRNRPPPSQFIPWIGLVGLR